MRAKDVSVGVQEVGDELIVLVRFRIRSAPLERELACPERSNVDPSLCGTRVKQSARTRKEKELQKTLEAIEFPE